MENVIRCGTTALRFSTALSALLVVFLAAPAYAGQTFNPHTRRIDKCMSMVEADGSPSNYGCQELQVDNGTMTANGDGTFGFSFGTSAVTFGDGTEDSITWTWDVTGVDPSVVYTDGSTNYNNALVVSGTLFLRDPDDDSLSRVHHSISEIQEGIAEHQQDIYLTTSGGNVFFEVEQTGGGGDITYIFDGDRYVLDCTTGAGSGGRAQVQLTEGTATTPVRNYIYVTPNSSDNSATLTASTSLPTGNFGWVGIATIQSDTEVAADGALLFQRTTEATKHSGRGQLSYMREKLRFLGAEYLNGIAQTLTITSAPNPDTVVLTTASGTVFQLHRQSWPAYDISSDGIWVANASGAGTLTNYQKLTDLNSVRETSDGTTIGNNERYNLVIWGAMNSANQAKLFVNLPTGTYNSDNEAIQDLDNTAVTTLPDEFQTTGFLVAKVVLKYTNVASGTFTNVLGGTSTTSLLGLSPGFNLGGSSGASTSSFNDANFQVFDDGDSTRLLKFEASGITSGQTRTLTAPDASGTICITGQNCAEGSFGITIDGGGSVITTGIKGYVEVPYAMTIDTWTLLSDEVGSIEVDVWKDTYANYPPTDIDSIVGSSKPTLSSAIKNQDTSIATWDNDVNAGDIIGFRVDSAAIITGTVTLVVSGTKT